MLTWAADLSVAESCRVGTGLSSVYRAATTWKRLHSNNVAFCHVTGGVWEGVGVTAVLSVSTRPAPPPPPPPPPPSCLTWVPPVHLIGHTSYHGKLEGIIWFLLNVIVYRNFFMTMTWWSRGMYWSMYWSNPWLTHWRVTRMGCVTRHVWLKWILLILDRSGFCFFREGIFDHFWSIILLNTRTYLVLTAWRILSGNPCSCGTEFPLG